MTKVERLEGLGGSTNGHRQTALWQWRQKGLGYSIGSDCFEGFPN